MKRREFISLLVGAIASPLAARAQEPGRTYRIGSLLPGSWDAPHHVAFRDELARLGFEDGANLMIDRVGHGIRQEQLIQHASTLALSRVDAFQCGGDSAIRAAQQASARIPILGLTDDMVGAGLVHSLAKPRGNTTGVSIHASELDAKRQELLLELVPTARQIAVLADPATTRPDQLRALQDAGAARGVKVTVQEVVRAEEIASAIEAAKVAGAAAINVLATPLFFNNRRIIFARTLALRLAAIYQWSEIAYDGGFAAYGPSILKIYRRQLAPMMAKLLRGTAPADLPVEQPSEFELVINQRTARALGLAIPEALLTRADAVIE